jgi:hypothetical protein
MPGRLLAQVARRREVVGPDLDDRSERAIPAARAQRQLPSQPADNRIAGTQAPGAIAISRFRGAAEVIGVIW